jgi:hypothetical protein
MNFRNLQSQESSIFVLLLSGEPVKVSSGNGNQGLQNAFTIAIEGHNEYYLNEKK